MLPQRVPKRTYLLLFTGLFFALDQGTKYFIREGLSRVGDVAVIGDLLRFSLVYNYHGVFGLSFGGPLFRWLLPFVGIAFVIYLGLKANSLFELFAYGLILGGATGNLCDRILFGRVTDFIDIGIGRWRWYTFNLADAFIVIGILLVILFRRERRSFPEVYGGKSENIS